MIDKIHLRNTLRKLRAVPFDLTDDVNVAMAPQEMLDYLAMLSGLKPVYLLGRGFNDHAWVKGVARLSAEKGLHVVHGVQWFAVPPNSEIPPQIAAIMTKEEEPAIYVCKGPGLAKELKDIAESGRISIEQEARLLGYPICCVRDHYQRQSLFEKAFWQMLKRAGRGDEQEIKRLIREDVRIAPETDEERGLLDEGTRMSLAPFTSIHMCRTSSVPTLHEAGCISC